MSFYMILPSNSCPLTQPENEANSFIVDWESAISLPGKWEVALMDISFDYAALSHLTPAFVTYEPRELRTYSVSIRDGWLAINNIAAPFKDDYLIIDVNRKDGKFEIISYLGKFATIKFTMLIEARKLGFNSVEVLIREPPYAKSSTKIDMKTAINCIMEIEFSDPNQQPVKTLSKNISELFNVDDVVEFYAIQYGNIFEAFRLNESNHLTFALKPTVAYVTFPKHIARELGFIHNNYFRYEDGKIYTGNIKPRIKVASQQYYIYSSIVDPILVGGVKVPLLKSLWINSTYSVGDVVNENMDNPMYLPISNYSINKIDVEIRDDSGKLVKFQKGSKSSLTLHFKKQDE